MKVSVGVDLHVDPGMGRPNRKAGADTQVRPYKKA
jgi:hypothetical protein